MKKVKISIAGALGRMGKILIKRINDNKNLKLCSLTDVDTSRSLQNIKIQKNSIEAFSNADVIIDFSKPQGSMNVIDLATKLKKNIVIGTTGFTEKQNKIIIKSSKKIAIFKAGNMSLGVNILQYISKIIAKKIPDNYKISITDNHHKRKIDYPSGTALMLAEAVAKGKGKKLKSLLGKYYFDKRIKPNILFFHKTYYIPINFENLDDAKENIKYWITRDKFIDCKVTNKFNLESKKLNFFINKLSTYF